VRLQIRRVSGRLRGRRIPPKTRDAQRRPSESGHPRRGRRRKVGARGASGKGGSGPPRGGRQIWRQARRVRGSREARAATGRWGEGRLRRREVARRSRVWVLSGDGHVTAPSRLPRASTTAPLIEVSGEDLKPGGQGWWSIRPNSSRAGARRCESQTPNPAFRQGQGSGPSGTADCERAEGAARGDGRPGNRGPRRDQGLFSWATRKVPRPPGPSGLTIERGEFVRHHGRHRVRGSPTLMNIIGCLDQPTRW